MSNPILAVTTALSLTSLAFAQAESATWIDMPFAGTCMDITPDGKWIVGGTGSGFAYRFDVDAGTFAALIGAADARAISHDGTVVVGCMPDPADGVDVAGIWSEANPTWVSLGYLPEALNCPSRSDAFDVSADGTVVTGLSWVGCSGRGFVWTQATGMLELESLANGHNRATAISADGTLITGFAQGSSTRTPAMWNAATTAGQLLDPPNGDALGEMFYVTDDAGEIYGSYNGDAIRWTEAGGVEVLGQGGVIPSWNSKAMCVAEDGTVVGFDSLSTNRQAWIQPQGQGDLIPLQTYIEGLGATVTNPLGLEVPTRITPDGTTIIGHGAAGAWRINLTYPSCTGDVDGDNNVGLNDLLAVLSNWGTDGQGADIAEPNNLVDFSDLLAVLAAWGTCP